MLSTLPDFVVLSIYVTSKGRKEIERKREKEKERARERTRKIDRERDRESLGMELIKYIRR